MSLNSQIIHCYVILLQGRKEVIQNINCIRYLVILLQKLYLQYYDKVTQMKKKRKFSSYIRKLWCELLQSHLWGRASLYMRKCANIKSYMRRPLVIYDFATVPFWISGYMRKILFSFLSVYSPLAGDRGDARVCWRG